MVTRRSRLRCVPVTLCLALVAGSLCAELRLASISWPPFSDGEGSARFAVDLVHEALRRAGQEVRTRIVVDGTLEDTLVAGTYDGSPAIWRSEAREAFLVYSRPYLQNRLVLVGLAGADVSAGDLDELAGRRVGIVQGYAYGDSVSGTSGAELVRGRSDQQNLERLLAGEVDLVLVDELLVHHLIRTHDEARDRLAIGTEPLLVKTLHFALRRDVEGAEDIVASFDDAFGSMIRDGSLNRLLGIAWIRADADGDGADEWIVPGTAAGTSAPAGGYHLIVTPGEQTDAGAVGYWIDGRAFQSWDQVPDHYKTESPLWEDTSGNAAEIFRLKF